MSLHHGLARPRLADGADALHVWKVAANVYDNESRTVDKGRLSCQGFV